ncbi:MAG TPA: tRNA guanosine(34) transglycosylase Tgt [Syntrophales bacterium]|nr:tRNA guanosine(34) transglycosylase Tgt [Syntrophales bacterium]HOM07881.1 tRNA guanosine(34) transglycosylase Tgt [Syntrophales bacterium]HOO00276.1 tRNA guanosine(34) transglycosylase Tgt [Syntrophales bacterium]HPC01775.1 tRNA guanosine(34) transglycosylase Tgt [Syntrophales bacterium]HPQ07372.1 tRNA guanosine(34) transglycosylase Tgt [Syntrophales bacterium]
MALSFTVIKTDASTGARLGRMATARGEVATPVFMPVGTQGTVKALTPAVLGELGVRVILANTYHLYLRPGHRLIEKAGGLHDFMNWPGPILTDSGGYQVFSLGGLSKVTEEGWTFRSHIDGSRHLLTPEGAVEIQEALDSDIMMCLDECTPYPATFEEARRSMARTLRWARRSLEARRDREKALFGIVQGGVHPSLRRESLEGLVETGFDGYALGGLSVGEPKEEMRGIVAETAPLMPPERPRYLMGVGTPEDIVEAVACGIDMFDCVLPTRGARNGLLFTNGGKLVIKHARFREDLGPVDALCDCYTCRNFSRAYLRHLFMSREILAMILNTIHNIRYYMNLMERIRAAIETGRFGVFKDSFLKREQETGGTNLD